MRYLFLFLPIFIFAKDMKQLDSITIISATRTEKIADDSPVKINLITNNEIKKTHAKNISEAVKYIPNLMIKETHGKQGDGVWIQGINSDRILVLINGEPMTSSTGTTVDISQINTSDVDKIEIIKGSSSALYGSSAIGGVINIITKEPKYEGLRSQLSIEGGSFLSKSPKTLGSSLIKASSSYKKDKHLLGVDFTYDYLAGIKLKKGRTYDIPQIDKFNINTLYKYKNKDFQWYIKPRYLYEKTNKPYVLFNPPFKVNQTKTEKTNKYRLSFGFDKDFLDSQLRFKSFYEYYHSNSVNDTDSTPYIEQDRTAKIDLVSFDLQYDKQINEEHLFTIGGTFKKEKMTQNNKKGSQSKIDKIIELGSNVKKENKEIFIQDDWFVSDNIEVIPGIRYQSDDGFGSYISPKLSVFYTPFNTDENRFNIRFSYGNGYKIPSLKERFFFFDHSAFGYKVLGEPNLNPETSKSYQLSSEFIQKDDYSFALNLFYNDIKNLILTSKDDKLSASTGLNIFRYQNIDKVSTKGLELEFDKKFFNYFTLSAGYTYLIAKNKITKKYLPQRPKHQLKLTLEVDYDDYIVLLALQKESKEYVDSQNKETSPAKTVVDVKLTKRINKSFEVYTGVDNILNQYKNPDDKNDLRTKRPRYYYLGINYKF